MTDRALFPPCYNRKMGYDVLYRSPPLRHAALLVLAAAGLSCKATRGDMHDALCLGAPPGASSDDTLTALGKVEGAREELADLFLVLDAAPRCQRYDAIVKSAELNGKAGWSCPVLKKNFACEPNADLDWICAQAKIFEQAHPHGASKEMRGWFRDGLRLGYVYDPDEPVPEPHAGALIQPTPKGTGESHGFGPDVDIIWQKDVRDCERHAEFVEIGRGEWSCPELRALLCSSE